MDKWINRKAFLVNQITHDKSGCSNELELELIIIKPLI